MFPLADSKTKGYKVVMRFANKSVLITGAARGIGAATAIAFAKEGAEVALFDLKPASVTAAAIKSLGRRCLEVQGDVSNPRANDNAVAEVVAAFGKLDVFVANAAYQHRGPFWEIPNDEYRRVVDVTMWGPLYGMRAAVVQMMKQEAKGNIVIVSSGQAEVPCPHSMPYNMAKAAIDHMARTAAIELFPHRIRVNIVHPGWTDTPGERKFFTDEEIYRTAEKTPGGRLAKPEEIAEGILYLADEKSEFLNGVTLPIGGGINLPRPWNV
jgi:glucose 1-dehydrogenase